MVRIIQLLTVGVFISGCGQPDSVRPPESASNTRPINKAMLPSDVTEQITALVRSGFYEREHLVEIVCEEIYAPGELDSGAVADAISEEFEKWRSEKKSWPDVTDCDRLDTAFAAISKRGIIALQNAGYTQSDGYDDCLEAFENHPDKSSVIGYCFYHVQDLERAVRGGGLNLAFGPIDSRDEKTKGPEIGKIVREELERVGFKVDWDGTFERRLNISGIVWQRRVIRSNDEDDRIAFGESEDRFELHIKPLVTGIGKSNSIVAYEGLPHQMFEVDRLAKELKSKKTMKLHGFPFYAPPITVQVDDAKQLTALCSTQSSFWRYTGKKQCGGFHPDWCLEFTNGADVYQVLICMGCHEARIYGPKNEVFSDLNNDALRHLGRILKPLRINRPR